MSQIFHRSTNTLSRATIFGAVFVVAALGWMAMECMSGGDLGRWLQEHGTPSAELAVRWFTEAGELDPAYPEPRYWLAQVYRKLGKAEEANRELQDLFARRALPHIVGYSVLATTAGAIPIPWLDLLILPGIQTRLIYHLAQLYGQPLSARHFLELSSTLGLGMLVRQASREVVKFIPVVGSVAGGVLAGAATFALGKAFCYYYSAVHKGHVPKPEDLRHYYQEQLALAEKSWKGGR